MRSMVYDFTLASYQSFAKIRFGSACKNGKRKINAKKFKFTQDPDTHEQILS